MIRFLLLAATAAETVIALRWLLTGVDQRRVRGFVRISWALLCALALALPVLEWSPRYYLLPAALPVIVIIGLRDLRVSGQAIGRWRIVPGAGAMVFLYAVAVLPALVFPEYRALTPMGTHAVASLTRTFTDHGRAESLGSAGGPRRVTVTFWHPEPAGGAAGSHPLLVFSHGGTGVHASNLTLYRELASHGYVIAAVDHPLHSLFSIDEHGRVTLIDAAYLRELLREDARADPAGSLELYRRWLDVRVADIAFVIDVVLAGGATGLDAAIFNLVDSARIALAGHSLGGAAALAVGREHPGIRAVIALEAPFLGDITGVDDAGFTWNEAPYPVPVLSIYSDSSWPHLHEWPQYAANQALLMAADPGSLSVHIAGVGHVGLTDLSLSSPVLTRGLDGMRPRVGAHEALGAINRISLAFLNEHLRD